MSLPRPAVMFPAIWCARLLALTRMIAATRPFCGGVYPGCARARSTLASSGIRYAPVFPNPEFACTITS